MNTEIVLRASGIEVTAEDESTALSYLREDGNQFRSSWSYDVDEISHTDEDPSGPDGIRIEAETSEPDGSGERTWTGDVLFTIVVEGDLDDEAAEAAAIELLSR